MRANPDMYASVNVSMQRSEQQLQTAMEQLSSGKRVERPSDDPVAFAANVQSLAQSATVDRYTKSADAVLAQAQMADAALSSVVTLLTQAVALGVQGGNDTVTPQQRAGIAQQVQGLLASVVNQANATDNGSALFAGTARTDTAFVPDASSSSGYAYQGDSESNQVSIGDSLSVTENVSGDQIFTSAFGNVLGSLQALQQALTAGDTADISDATAGVSAAIAHVGQMRAVYANTVNQVNAQSDYLSQESVSLTSQQNGLVAMDTARAAVNLTQAQTAQSAVLAMAAKILPMSLLNYLER